MATASSTPAVPQITTITNLNAFDQSTDSYNGYVSISATPRPGVNFSVMLPFHGAKNEKDALAQVKPSLDKVLEDIHESAAAH